MCWPAGCARSHPQVIFFSLLFNRCQLARSEGNSAIRAAAGISYKSGTELRHRRSGVWHGRAICLLSTTTHFALIALTPRFRVASGHRETYDVQSLSSQVQRRPPFHQVLTFSTRFRCACVRFPFSLSFILLFSLTFSLCTIRFSTCFHHS